MNKKKDHDGMFKTAFRDPKRAAALLKLAARKNRRLARFLKVVGDIDFSKLNPYVSQALVAMKYVFNAGKYKPVMDKAMAYFLDPKNKIDSSFIQEVLLYLGEETSSEYREAIMDRPEIMAERKRNGFVSVADVLRAEGEIIGEAKGREQEHAKAEEEFLQQKLSAARDLILRGVPKEIAAKSLKLTEEQVASL